MSDWDDEIHRALAHPIRRRIIERLHERDELSFYEMLESTGVANHGKVGFHLRALSGLVEVDPSKRKYRLTDRGRLAAELVADTRFLISKGAKGLPHEPGRYVRQLGPQDHAVLFYDTEELKRQISYPFLYVGLLKGEAVVYLVPENKLELETREIIWYGIDVDYFSKKAFKIMSAEDWYLNKGKANAETIVKNWQALLRQKKKAGFRGLRAAGEMEVFFNNAKTEELLRYEAALGRQLPTDLCGLCLYNTHDLEKTQFDRLQNLHGHVIFRNIALGTT